MPDPAAHLDNWPARGLCHADPDRQFPDSELRGPELRLAKKTCLHCPVRELCLRAAIHNGEAYGIWGGLATDERHAHAAGSPIYTCQRCGLLYANRYMAGTCRPCTPLGQRRTTKLRTAIAPRAAAATKSPTTTDPRCGTDRGYSAHLRRQERPCLPCYRARQAAKAARNAWRRLDLDRVRMAADGRPPQKRLTAAERRAVAELLLPQQLPTVEMARRMTCNVRSVQRIAAKLREQHPAPPAALAVAA